MVSRSGKDVVKTNMTWPFYVMCHIVVRLDTSIKINVKKIPLTLT